MTKKSKSKKTNKTNKVNIKSISIVLLLLFSLAFILIVGNNTGFIGYRLKSLFFYLIGMGTYFLLILIILHLLVYLFGKLHERLNIIFLLLYGLLLLSMVIIDLNMNAGDTLNLRLANSTLLSEKYLGSGIIGSFIASFLLNSIGRTGIYFIVIIYLFFSGIYIFNISINNLFFEIKDIFYKSTFFIKKTYNKHVNLRKKKNKPKTIKSIKVENNEKNISIEPQNIDILYNDYNENVENYDNNIKKSDKGTQLSVEDINNININIESIVPYKFPPLELLCNSDPSNGDNKVLILEKAKKIEQTLLNFGVDATVVEINKGPTITCYELEPSPGVKVSKIVNLSDDLAMSLASSDIRIEAPIPGKSVIGIEVPNLSKEDVCLKDIIDSIEFREIQSKIPIALGKSISGKTIVTSIEKMPHLLIAGATGSGKSVCINSIILSILFKSSPEDVKLILIDPKVVELSIYNGISHLAIPVVTNAKKANFALSWAVTEMERRYKIFSENYVRDINSYNKKNINNNLEKLPYIVIIIDELSDLMMVAAGEVEESIARLAQMARACGIHLIVATQRPSVDVITGTIKANIPSRISFAVSSQIDSRTILDISGAEKLLGKGDMLYYPSNLPKPIRIQGAFVSDKEVERIVEYLKSQNKVNYNKEIIENIDKKQKEHENFESNDELLKDAIRIILEENSASISLLQRKMKIGYARAGRIIDEMEELEIISGYEGSKPRKILVGKDYLKEIGE